MSLEVLARHDRKMFISGLTRRIYGLKKWSVNPEVRMNLVGFELKMEVYMECTDGRAEKRLRS